MHCLFMQPILQHIRQPLFDPSCGRLQYHSKRTLRKAVRTEGLILTLSSCSSSLLCSELIHQVLIALSHLTQASIQV